MDKKLQEFINEDEMSYEHAYFSLSKFIGETYVANQKVTEGVGKDSSKIEREEREQIEQINAWANLIDKLY